MSVLLALRNFATRPWRTLFLLLGYALGVAVMIVLLSVGEALLTQARQERVVGGGDVTVLPQGVDLEVLKTGGLGGMFFSIDHARFEYRQLLAAPRLAPFVRDVAPQIDEKLLYLQTSRGPLPVTASGEIPSRMVAVGAAGDVTQGLWMDDDGDRAWMAPTPYQLRNEIDHFHLPSDSVAHDPTWAEWHYFNVLSADHTRWAFVSFIVAGAERQGPNHWGGQVLVTLHQDGQPPRRFTAEVPASAVAFSTSRADVTIGQSSVRLAPDGRYAVRAHATEPDGAAVDVDLVVSPAPYAYFPGAALSSGTLVSGYVVPALRADASGSICVSAAPCTRFNAAQSYHDHNWGVWRGVTWEWGSARAGPYSILYGRVQPSDSAVASEPLFLFVVDSLGFTGLFRPRAIAYVEGRHTLVDGRSIATPSRATLMDTRGSDTLRVDLVIDDAMATDTRRPGAERGQGTLLRQLARPYFVQMKGTARLTGRIGGRVVNSIGAGFFETYR